MNEKPAYQLLLEMTPEEKKGDVERIFREYKLIDDENDILFQIILVMGIYQNFIRNIPEKFQKAADDFHQSANTELKAMIKITKINAKIEKQLQYFTVSMYVFILVAASLIAGSFFIYSYPDSVNTKNPEGIKELVLPVNPENISETENSFIDDINQDKSK